MYMREGQKTPVYRLESRKDRAILIMIRVCTNRSKHPIRGYSSGSNS
uniref:Uncharacterized protein n=1 Tax=Setaria italica TaxID=4555 RepID=K3YXP1_SETIT